MNIVFAETEIGHQQLLPLTYTRPIANLRVGILTIDKKWVKRLSAKSFGYQTEAYLQEKFPRIESDDHTLWIIDGILPGEPLVKAIKELKTNQALTLDDKIIIAKGSQNPISNPSAYEPIELNFSILQIIRSWDIFRNNGEEIRNDFALITAERKSAEVQDSHTIIYGSQNVFLEEGVTIKAAVLNAENGPIYIGKNCEIQEGALIRGPFALGENSIVAMGTKVRGDTSTGPYCKIGGEISNSIFWGYSNKGHDGFLGNSVIGEWCNFGAGTNNSNLKNNYDPVKMWDYVSGHFIPTDLQFCGLIMGDHSKTAIGTIFNTGTTVGIVSNIYGNGFPRVIIPSFAWGGSEGFVTHHPRKAFITAEKVMNRRNLELSQTDKDILNYIFEASAQYRVWENKD